MLWNKTAKNIYLLMIGNLWDAVFAFLFTLGIFKALPLSDFGIFSAINNFIFTAVLILDVGIGGALLNFVPSSPKNAGKYLSSGLAMRGILSGIFALIVICLSPVISHFFSTNNYLILILAGFSIFVLSLIDVLAFSLQSLKLFGKSVLAANSFSSFRFLGLLIVFWLGLKVNLIFAFVITLLSPVVGIVLGFWWINKKYVLEKFSLLNVRQMMGYGGWMGLGKIMFTIATRIDIQIVLLFLGANLAGIYSVAARLANFYQMTGISLISVLATKVSAMSDRNDLNNFLKKALLAAVLLSGLMIFGIIIANPLIPVLFGIKSFEAIVPFRWLTLAYIPYIFSCVLQVVIAYWHKDSRIIGIISTIHFMSILMINLVIRGNWGLLGPIVALGVSNVLLLGIEIIYLLKK